MLMRNLSVERGLSNGTRMEVLRFSKGAVICKVLDGPSAGQIEPIPKITLHCSDEFPFTLVINFVYFTLIKMFLVTPSISAKVELCYDHKQKSRSDFGNGWVGPPYRRLLTWTTLCGFIPVSLMGFYHRSVTR